MGGGAAHDGGLLSGDAGAAGPEGGAAPRSRQLRASQERYREFVSNSAVGVWMVEMNPPLRTDLPADEQIAAMYKNARMVECNDAMARCTDSSGARSC